MEIIIVLSIIGFITVFSTVNGPIQIQKARDAIRKSHIDTIRKTIEEYYEDNNCYPQTIPACGNSFNSENLTLLYRIPCDPSSKLSYTYVPEPNSCPHWYQLYSNLENSKDKIIEKIGCQSGCGPDCNFNYGVSSPNQKIKQFCSNSPNASPSPIVNVKLDQYVCSQNGICEIFIDPNLSGCPNIYMNDSTCQNACNKRENRCHDARGKKN